MKGKRCRINGVREWCIFHNSRNVNYIFLLLFHDLLLSFDPSRINIYIYITTSHEITPSCTPKDGLVKESSPKNDLTIDFINTLAKVILGIIQKNVVLFREIFPAWMVLSWSSIAEPKNFGFQTPLCNVHPTCGIFTPTIGFMTLPYSMVNNGSLDSSTHGDGIFNNAPTVAPATGQWVHLHGQSLQISPKRPETWKNNFPGKGKTGNFVFVKLSCVCRV